MKKNHLILSVIFCLGVWTIQGQVTDIFSFNDSTGSAPSGSLVLSEEVLYGMTNAGGKSGVGCIFSVTDNGSVYKDIWDFKDTGLVGNANGANPMGSLTIIGANLYGMTEYGGAHHMGCIFSINTNGGGYRDIWDFYDTGADGNANGIFPFGSLISSGNKLYGMTDEGGAYGSGIIFSVDTNGGNFKDLTDFYFYSNGAYPKGSLTLSGNKLYGIAEKGGPPKYFGLIFSLDTNGKNFKDLFDFDVTNGSYPMGDLTISGNTLFGMTWGGGSYYDGVIFSMDTNGSKFKNLLEFNGINGEHPNGSLIISGNKLYGMTQYGGVPNSSGVVFSIDTNGEEYTILNTFNNKNGAYPMGNLTRSGGTLYGMTSGGGAMDYGLIFSDNICNLLTVTSEVVADGGNCNGVATAKGSGGPTPFAYLWSPGGQTADTIKGQCTGNYCCKVTDNNGCSQTACVEIVTGIENIKPGSAQISIYPVPNNGSFIMASKGINETLYVEIYNVLGEKVYIKELNSTKTQINLSNEAKGLYLYRVLNKAGYLISSDKFIIQ